MSKLRMKLFRVPDMRSIGGAILNRYHIGQLRKTYLKEQHPNLYRELHDDGVLGAHLRHVQGKAQVYFDALIKAGHCAGRAEEKVIETIIFSCPKRHRT